MLLLEQHQLLQLYRLLVLIIIPISAVIACTLSLGNKVLHKLIIQKINIFKKQNERDQQTIETSDNFYRKSLQENVSSKSQSRSGGGCGGPTCIKIGYSGREPRRALRPCNKIGYSSAMC